MPWMCCVAQRKGDRVRAALQQMKRLALAEAKMADVEAALAKLQKAVRRRRALARPGGCAGALSAPVQPWRPGGPLPSAPAAPLP